MKRELPKRVYLKHGAFWFVDLQRKWHRLCAEKDDLAGMYRALATLTEREATSDRMPAVLVRWMDETRAEKGWKASTVRNRERQIMVLSRKLAEFTPAQVTTAVAKEVLDAFKATPRTFNQYRDVLRQVMAFAAGESLREDFNPIDNIKGKTERKRKRIVSDAEIAAIKAAALERDGKPVRNGRALVQMIDLALLTGQRIGDVIGWRWQDVTDAGLLVTQQKTGKRLVIELTPALRAALAECAKGHHKIGHILKTQSGSGYKYAGIRSAWVRACERAGVEDLNIHDMRGRAGTDKEAELGMEAAKNLLGHDQLSTTEGYVEGKRVRRVKPTK